MRLVTFAVATPVGTFERLGALDAAGAIVDLNAAFGAFLEADGESQPGRLAAVVLPADMLGFLEMGGTGIDAAHRALDWVASATAAGEPPVGPGGEQVTYPPGTVRLLAPLPRPPSLRDFLAFEVHTRAGFARRDEPIPEAWYTMPVYYKGNHRSIVGPDADVRWPAYTERLDYELELACVIGRPGRDLSADDAGRYIAGYTAMNDWSARDIQRSEMTVRLGPAKGKDFATSLGPCLVTPDELDPRNLRMIARVNGEVWSDGNAGTSRWTFPQMIAHVSRDEDVFAGDVLGSGTVGGGCGLELDRWLAPGDVVELEIEGIGVLRNRVVRERR
jgi:2-keto-4-pentenoate hydratase/2-oxohepta-3-ene-1,7-dioic acid hydratase in catechol pathway